MMMTMLGDQCEESMCAVRLLSKLAENFYVLASRRAFSEESASGRARRCDQTVPNGALVLRPRPAPPRAPPSLIYMPPRSPPPPARPRPIAQDLDF